MCPEHNIGNESAHRALTPKVLVWTDAATGGSRRPPTPGEAGKISRRSHPNAVLSVAPAAAMDVSVGVGAAASPTPAQPCRGTPRRSGCVGWRRRGWRPPTPGEAERCPWVSSTLGEAGKNTSLHSPKCGVAKSVLLGGMIWTWSGDGLHRVKPGASQRSGPGPDSGPSKVGWRTARRYPSGPSRSAFRGRTKTRSFFNEPSKEGLTETGVLGSPKRRADL